MVLTEEQHSTRQTGYFTNLPEPPTMVFLGLLYVLEPEGGTSFTTPGETSQMNHRRLEKSQDGHYFQHPVSK